MYSMPFVFFLGGEAEGGAEATGVLSQNFGCGWNTGRSVQLAFTNGFLSDAHMIVLWCKLEPIYWRLGSRRNIALPTQTPVAQ